MLPGQRRAAQREFFDRVAARLDQGANEYHDAGFGYSLQRLCEEIQQELDDIAGYAFLMSQRVKMLTRLGGIIDDVASEAEGPEVGGT